MSCRSLLLSAGLLAIAACSSPSVGTFPGDGAFDAQTDGPVASDDGADSGEPSGDASASHESGAGPVNHDAGTAPGRDAGTAPGRDAGTVHVTCNEPTFNVCQTAAVSANAAASWRTQCTSQGGKDEPCPTSGLIGCCVGDTSRYCYYPPINTLAIAQMDCSTMNGTWSTSM